MSATSGSAKVAPGTISFELERFERIDGRLELSGRWFGVRGLRFVRPTLTLVFDDESSSRSHADLEHKPWAPLDGETWDAAFPCPEDVVVLDAELAVAPGIAIRLPAPGDALADADPIAVLPSESGTARTRGPAPARRKHRSAVPGELAALREETQRLRQEPIRLQAQLDRSEQLRKHVEGELERLKMDADGALARRDAAVDRFEGATAARDEATRERDEAVRARDAAMAERDSAIADRDAAVAERDAAMSSSEDAISDRARALAERDKAAAERNAAVSERDKAIAERDKAVSGRDKAIAERDKARSQRPASISPPVQTARPTRPGPVFSENQDQLIKRALAIAVLIVAVFALLIVVGVL